MGKRRILSFRKKSVFFMLIAGVGIFLGWSGLSHAAPNEKDALDQSVRDSGITPESIRVHHQAHVEIATKAGGLDSGIRLNEAGRESVEYLLKGYQQAGFQNARLEELLLDSYLKPIAQRN